MKIEKINYQIKALNFPFSTIINLSLFSIFSHNAPNFVPNNVVSENAETAENVGQVWLLIFKDRFRN